jgi:hypothetical protein
MVAVALACSKQPQPSPARLLDTTTTESRSPDGACLCCQWPCMCYLADSSAGDSYCPSALVPGCQLLGAHASSVMLKLAKTKICDTLACAPSSPHPSFGRRYAAPGPCCIVCARDFLGITPPRRPLVPVSAVATPKGGAHGAGASFVFSLFPFFHKLVFCLCTI